MASFLRKYATGAGADIIIPVIKAGSDDFALSADWTPAAGDVKVSKDGGAAANIGTLPTFITSIGWKFVFTNTELTAARVNINIVDSATKAVKDQHIVIDTYGNANAQHAFDLDNAINASSGIVESNLKQINSNSVVGNAATLTLKQLDIQNDGGTAVIMKATAEGNGVGLEIAGDGTGVGASITGGATANGINIVGGSTSGVGMKINTTNGHGISVNAAGTGRNGMILETTDGDAFAAIATGNYSGIRAQGDNTGHGIRANAGDNGSGIIATGGTTTGEGIKAIGGVSGVGFLAQGTGGEAGIKAMGHSGSSGIYAVGGATGHGVEASGGSTSGNGILAMAPISGDGIEAVGTDADIRGDITGNLSGSVGSVTGAVGSVTAGVIVTTNNDKTGYSISGSITTLDGLNNFDYTTEGVIVTTNNDKTGYSISGSKTTLDALNDLSGADVQLEAEDAIDAKFAFTAGNVNANAKAISDSTAAADSVEANIGNLDVAVSTRSTFDRTSEGVIVTTNNDKAGYSISGSITTLDGLENIAVADITTVVETALATTTRAEKALGQPAAVDSIAGMLTRLYGAQVFEGQQSNAEPGWKTFYNSVGTPIWKKQTSDDGTDYTETRGVTA